MLKFESAPFCCPAIFARAPPGSQVNEFGNPSLAGDVWLVFVRGVVAPVILVERAEREQHRGEYHAARDDRDRALAEPQPAAQKEIKQEPNERKNRNEPDEFEHKDECREGDP